VTVTIKSMAELPDDLYEQIQSLCEVGDQHGEAGEPAAAIDAYNRAWALLPEPKNEWAAATWILAAIGDTHFLGGDFDKAHTALMTAIACPDGFGNPFIHLRLGQTEFELGNHDQSANELTRAFGLEGSAIFANEDPKYFEFLKTRIKPPAGGWESA
jgi:tetratricopeptide (TPR) repeat protein